MSSDSWSNRQASGAGRAGCSSATATGSRFAWGPQAGDPGAAAVPKVSAKLLASLSETERLGVQALQLRASKPYIKAKAKRPRQGEVWDMPGCGGAPAPPHFDAGASRIRSARPPSALPPLRTPVPRGRATT